MLRRIWHIARLIFKFMIIIFLINFMFALIFNNNDAITFTNDKIKRDITLLESLYFSIVSLLTIGYGDIAPNIKNGFDIVLLFIQGIVGVCIFAILQSTLTVKLFNRDNNVFIKKKIIIEKVKDSLFVLKIIVINDGRPLYNIKAKILLNHSKDESSNDCYKRNVEKDFLVKHTVFEFDITKDILLYFKENYKAKKGDIFFSFTADDTKTGIEIKKNERISYKNITFGHVELDKKNRCKIKEIKSHKNRL